MAGVDVLASPDRVRWAIGLVAQRSGLDPEVRADTWAEFAHLHLAGHRAFRTYQRSI